jgi:short-subunit dehydrogenase
VFFQIGITIHAMNFVITGASSGIGRALAKTFAHHGHTVLATARRAERLQAVCQEMTEAQAAPVACLALDLTEPSAPRALFDEAVRVLGKVHGLINAAGMSPYQPFCELNETHLVQTIALNITALTELCHLFLAHMRAHGEPSRLVNVGSVGGYLPLPRFAVYSGSKHYVRVFTNLLGHECRGTNIRVSALHPGGTLTEFQALAGERMRQFASRTLMNPEQVAAIAYPAILKGKRVIVPGLMNQASVLLGKLLPFPWAIRLTEFIYNHSLDPVPPTYPL